MSLMIREITSAENNFFFVWLLHAYRNIVAMLGSNVIWKATFIDILKKIILNEPRPHFWQGERSYKKL